MPKTLSETVSTLKGAMESVLDTQHQGAIVQVHVDELEQLFSALALGGDISARKTALEQEVNDHRKENEHLRNQLATLSDDFQAANARIAELVEEAKKQPPLFEQLHARCIALQARVTELENPTHETLQQLIADYAAKRGIPQMSDSEED